MFAKYLISLLILLLVSGTALFAISKPTNPNTKSHVTSKDLKLIDDAFIHGYQHNMIVEKVNGKDYPTLGIQCITFGEHHPNHYGSVWTRDLYWGFLGWSQAGNDEVLGRMKSSIQLLAFAKNKNQALGQSKLWPLNDERFYIPQAYTQGLKIAENMFPWCSESQPDFLLLAYDYWKLTGDIEFIRSIWPDICYVQRTIELMDTNGNLLPDQLWGSYDYQGLGNNFEEPLMSAKTSVAYWAVAQLARQLNKEAMATRLEDLSDNVKAQMNKPISEGGMWKPLDGDNGYYINMRDITKGSAGVDERFVPYENLGPMFLGITSEQQDKAIFKHLDDNFDKYYNLKYGPMYIAFILQREKTEVQYSSTPWLGFLDVYLRCKKGHQPNRSKIFKMLIDHAYDVPAGCFTEGIGIIGHLTGNSGRSWDNGNFFHTLITGIYGIEKSKDGVMIEPPAKMDSMAVTELKNLCWRDAVYDLKWQGDGSNIKSVTLDGKKVAPDNAQKPNKYLLTLKSGRHKVVIELQ